MKFFKAFIAWTQSFNSCIIGLEKRISELKDSVESKGSQYLQLMIFYLEMRLNETE